MIEFGSWTMQAYYIHISDNEEFNRYTAHYILFNEDYGDSWSVYKHTRCMQAKYDHVSWFQCTVL